MRAARELVGLAALLAAFATDNGAAAGLVLHHAYFRRPSGLDTGTVVVFLHNGGRESARVAEVSLDGVPLAVRGVFDAADPADGDGKPRLRVHLDPSMALSARRVLWAYLDPNPVPPGGTAALRLKLAEKPSRPLSVSLRTATGAVLRRALAPRPAKLRISHLAFGDHRRRLFITLVNQSPQTLHLDRLWVNGEDRVDHLSLRPREFPSKEKTPLVCVLPDSLPLGGSVTVKVTTREGEAAAERARAFSYFALSADGGGTGPAGVHLDAQAFTDVYARNVEKTTGVTKCIFVCPMHAFAGDLRRAGDEAVRRGLAYRRRDPVAPTSIHICRSSAEKGYVLFGEAADSVRMNPFLRSAYFRPDPDAPEHVAQWRTALAKRGCQPRPLFTVLDLARCSPPDAARGEPAITPRLGAYYVLSRGSKGLLYRGLGAWMKAPRRRAAIAALNAELQALKPLLAVAEPFGRLKTSEPCVEAVLLLCGDRGALLLLLNHTRLPEAAGGHGAHEPVGPIQVTLPRRDWLAVTAATALPRPDEAPPPLPIERRGGVPVLVVPRLDEAQAYRLQ